MTTPTEPNWEPHDYLLQPDRAEAARAAPARDQNLRRVRRVSNWSLAALLVGVGATSAVLAHVVPGHASPAVYAGSTSGGGLVQGGPVQASSGSGQAPSVSGPVAVSSGSQVVAGSTVTGPGQSATQPGATVTGGSTWKDS